jgi:hypothetical protein
MLALKEFADFISLNLTSLATTYTRLLVENKPAYQAAPLDRRVAAARKLLQAVVAAWWLEYSPSPGYLFHAFALRKSVVENYLWSILFEVWATGFCATMNPPFFPPLYLPKE